MDGISVTPKAPPAGEEATTTPAADVAGAATPSDNGELAVTRLELASYLGVRDISDSKFLFVLEELTKDGPTKGDMFTEIRHIETKMGLPRFGLGENRLGLLYNYLKLERTLTNTTKLRDSYLA